MNVARQARGARVAMTFHVTAITSALSWARPPNTVRPMRWHKLAVLVFVAFAACARAESAKVIKVLPQFLDLKGRTTVNPSLFDRDAYQQDLRATPTNRSALRFNVQWKARGHDALLLRIDATGMKGKEPTNTILEQPVKPGTFSKWTAVTLGGEEYKNFGELVSWRVTLLSGTNVVAEQKSFLW